MAEVAAVGGPRWFQVYLLADPGARRALVERAVDEGYEALVLTVDLQRLGRRERDIRVGFRDPVRRQRPERGDRGRARRWRTAADQSFVESV